MNSSKILNYQNQVLEETRIKAEKLGKTDAYRLDKYYIIHLLIIYLEHI